MSTVTLDPADVEQIAKVPERMVALWAAHDAEAFADLFTPDGTMLLPGIHQKGREAIRAFMAAAYAGPFQGTRVVGSPIEVKPLGPDAVALVTEGGVVKAGADALADADAIRASWILVKREGRWQLAVYQNCPRDPK